ncbi:imm11 family protein [Spartinivicinus ruber]|uniref:imm11 family protein n=1 Tax=Spartinivicinus ruber TaxID=2683272 RepID=UPI0013D13112|nr:hypothetical protein [Spartinivicinus ruber]
MTNYNEQYYILDTFYNDNQLHITADNKTSNRNYEYEKLVPSGVPLFFENSFKDKEKALGRKRLLTDVLFDGSSLVVVYKIHDFLKMFSTKGMQLYPAIYIDDDTNWHENYWYLNFFEKLDCWDRKLSVLETFDDEDDDFDAEIRKYYLDKKVLDAIPEEQRYLFKMGGATESYIFAHERLVDIFKRRNYT